MDYIFYKSMQPLDILATQFNHTDGYLKLYINKYKLGKWFKNYKTSSDLLKN